MLTLEGISAGYGETVVLRHVTVRVPSGATVALLGPNGAGKTTLLKVASGLLRPRSGRVLLDDTEITGHPSHELSELGICHVPEGRGVFPSLSVRENLVLHTTGDRTEAIEKAVAAFPILGQRISQIAGTLSGGEQQMLALARAYVAQPRVVLLDEVSMGLAPKIVDDIFVFLEKLSAEGAALLLVEQYVTRALSVADYVYMLNRGRLVFCGEPGELEDEDVFASYLGTKSESAVPIGH